ncbi:MFS transporter [Nocardiopsis sp. B62]|uniref:MFS transporter n=1 Tax=Nocardiopsis sp. B62 TaxID=2824874 RepID=UPI001B36BF9C|nr:MFS transporter [Nocardiopsis sp. B62]MBQ1083927.1 MFS transporter [Nocardiopsis sp. B62]
MPDDPPNPAAPAARRLRAAALLTAILLSSMGDEVVLVAAVFQLAETGNSLWVTALLTAQIGPLVLLAPLAGAVLDRFDTGRVLVLACVGQGLAILPAVWFPHPGVLVLCVLTVSSLAALVNPAILTLLPGAAGDLSPVHANSLFEGARASATVLGPLVGGVLVGLFGIVPALLTDSASFFVAAGTFLLLGVRRPAASTTGTLWSGALDGARHVLRARLFRVLMPVLLLAVVATSTTNVAMVFVTREVMGHGAEVFGALTAGWGAGLLSGALAVSVLRPAPTGRGVALAAALVGAALALWAWFPVLWVAAVCVVLAGAGNSVFNILLRSVVHRHTPESLLGRAHALMGAVVNGGFVVGFLIAGWFAADHPRELLAAAGSVALLAGLVGALVVRLSGAETGTAGTDGTDGDPGVPEGRIA